MNEEDAAKTALIGIDWGTSRLRGFRIDSEGQLLEHRESALGIAAIRDGGFDRALYALIADWQPAPGAIPILMCGMIGSRQGWGEAPYRSCPAAPADLIDTLVQIDTSCGPALIIGGLSTTDGNGIHDVMRGEEMQILGGAPPAGRQLVIAPGTHSKWALVENGRIESFRTYMTGEVYDLLRAHSSLGWLMRDEGSASQDEEAFVTGVRQALADSDLLHLLFSVRTSGLFGDKPPEALSPYLSGLLIGSEIAGELRRHAAGPIIIIAAPQLARLYGIALSVAGRSNFQHVDASEAAARGLWRLWQLHRMEACQ